MEKITRTISTSTISYCTMAVKDGQAVPGPIQTHTLVGEKLDADKAPAMLRKLHPAATTVVLAVAVAEKVYEMTMDKFVQNATVLDADEQAKREAARAAQQVRRAEEKAKSIQTGAGEVKPVSEAGK